MNTDAYSATHDALTRLPNEFLFMDRLNQLVATSERSTNLFALLILVPDNLTRILDVEGTGFSDELIIEIAGRLKVALREPDTVTRREDNTFAILIPQIESRQALDFLITRLRKTLTESFQVRSSGVRMTFSIGKAIYPYDGTDTETLLRAAGTDLQSDHRD